MNCAASGQRTAFVNASKVNGYPVLDLNKSSSVGKNFYYLGSVENDSHLLALIKTTVSNIKSEDERVIIGRPVDKVFIYKLAIDDLTIINGWTIPPSQLAKGFSITLNTCPKIRLHRKFKNYELSWSDKQLGCGHDVTN